MKAICSPPICHLGAHLLIRSSQASTHGSFIATGSKLGITLQMGWISSEFGGERRYGTPIDDTIQRIQAELDRASSIHEIHVIEIDGWLYYVSNRCL